MNKIKPILSLDKVKEVIGEHFASLDFNEEAHKYKYEGRELMSVSHYIKQFTKPFEADKIAGFVAKSRGVTKQEILDEWEENKNRACEQGNRVHYFGEHFQEMNLNPSDGLEQAVVKFWEDLPDHIIPVFNELQMFSEEYGVAGTADIILFNTKTGRFIIGDYKTNKDLFKNHRGQKLLNDFDFLLDRPISKYEIQLSFYQLLFEQCGFEVEKRVIVWVKPDGTYEKFFTRDLRENIQLSFMDKEQIELEETKKVTQGEDW